MVSKTFILASLAAVVVSAFPADESTTIEQGTVPYCSDLLFVDDGSFHEVNCTIKAENVEHFQFSFPELDPVDVVDSSDDVDTNSNTDNGVMIDNTASPVTIVRRNKKKKKENPVPVSVPVIPSMPENERILWHEAGDSDTTFKQCINNGPSPRLEDVKALCAKVDTNYVIRRAGQTLPPPNGKIQNPNQEATAGPCTCKVWSYKTAVFSVCNCDKCEALIIPSGLRDKCREISQHCTIKGFSSGFIKMPENAAVYEQHMTGEGEKADAKLGMGDLGQAMQQTCKSGDEGKVGQDISGPFIQCTRENPYPRMRHTRICWRVTDPSNFWYVKTK